MATADDRETVKSLWEWNFLNIRKSTTDSLVSGNPVSVAFELYDVSLDRQGNLYPWVKETFQLLSSCPKYSLFIWTVYNEQTARKVYDTVFYPNNIRVLGINEGLFIYDKNYSSVKPLININLDLSSGFSPEQWYVVHNLFKVSESILCKKDNSAARSIIRGTGQYSVRPTTVKIPNNGIPVAKPAK